MDDQKEKSGCLDNDKMYPQGSELCKDLYWDEYCFKCVDGKWESRIGQVLGWALRNSYKVIKRSSHLHKNPEKIILFRAFQQK